MNTEKKDRNPSIFDQLLVVNGPAGRLRFVLLLIIYFILWSLIAQTNLSHPEFLEGLAAGLPEPANFTSGIIKDLLLMYFSPIAIFLTIFPLFIFLMTRNIFRQFLQTLFPVIQRNGIKRFLNNCAFSFSQLRLNLKTRQNANSQQLVEQASKLGGPINVSFPPDSLPIIENMINNTYQLLIPNKNINNFEYSLPFGEKITSVISKNDNRIYFDQICIPDRFDRDIQINKINLSIDIKLTETKSKAPFSIKITKPDTLFLSGSGIDGKDLIRSFINDEIKYFFFFESSNSNWGIDFLTYEKTDRKIYSNPLKKKEHSIFTASIKIRKPFSKNIFRKHKHSIYPFLKNSIFSLENNQNKHEEIKRVEKKLIEYLNDQIKFFFHTSNILISKILIGEIKINR